MSTQKRFSFIVTALSLVALLGFALPVFGQFGTPSVDGTITPGEYGLHTNGQNQQTSGSTTTYMTWDNTNLYIGIDVANVAEGAVIYLDANPVTPINAGNNTNGNLTGQNYDGTNFGHLPFRADFVAYFKNGYREYRTAVGDGTWSAPTAGFGSYADDASDTRELAIPWSAITGSGRPANFAWFGYATSAGGFVYGQVPTQNAGGAIGVTAVYNRYYAIRNTNTGTSTPPFNRLGYAQNFDTLANTGTTNPWVDNTTLPDWYAMQTIGTLSAYRADNGASTTGALYSYGTTATTERAMASIASGTPGNFIYGYKFTNNTNSTIASFNISYIGEQWRNGGNATPQKLDFAYQVNAAGLNTGTWTNVDNLDFTGPIATATAAALDGNASANRVILSQVVTVTVPVGDSILFRLFDTNDAGADHGLGTDSFTVVANPLVPQPDLTISKTGAALAVPDAIITYTLSFTNSGNLLANGVRITDTLPAGVSYVSDDSGFTCPACVNGATGNLVWMVGTLASGANDSFQVVAHVANNVPYGTNLTNQAHIDTPDTESNTSNNNDVWVTQISPLDVSISKTGPTLGFAGTPLMYTLTIQNTGVATATNVIFTDTLPAGATYLDDNNPWACSGCTIGGNGPVVWSGGTVPPNTAYTFNLTVTVGSGVGNGTVLTNHALASTNVAGDPQGNNVAQWSTTIYNIVPVATVRAGTNGQTYGVMGKVIYVPGTYSPNGWGLQDASGGIAVFYTSPPAVSLGDTVVLVATRGVFSGEEQLAAPVTFFQNMGSGPEVAPTPYTTGQLAGGTAEGWLAQVTGTVSGLTCPTTGNYQFNVDDGSGTAVVFVDVDTTVDVCGGGLQNGMTAIVKGFATQFNTTNEIKPRRPSDVQFLSTTPGINKTAPSQAAPSSIFTYTIAVDNFLGYTLNNVVITDSVPSEATFASVSDGGVYNNGVVTWTIPSMADGSSTTVRFAVTAPAQTAVVVNDQYAVWASNYTTPTVGSGVSTLIVSGQVHIHDIQESRHYSLLTGQAVTDVPGIVTVVRSTGFYMQDPTPDNDPATSEGIFVFINGAPSVSVGDSVLVDGTVNEFYSGGIGANGLSTTEISASNANVTIQSSGNPLPPYTIIGNGGRIPPNQIIDNDSNGDVNNNTAFDPDQDGIDFYESLEGMLVQVNNALVVGSTNSSFGEIGIVGDNGANATVISARGVNVIQEGDFNPERIIIDDTIITAEPTVLVGDTFTGPIVGVIDYSFGNFKLFNTVALPSVVSGGLAQETTTLTPSSTQLLISTFNVENLDPGDGQAKFDTLAGMITNNLNSPDIVSLEEMQDNNGPTDNGVVDADVTFGMLIDAIAAAGGPTYEYRQINPVNDQDGGEPGGNIRVGFLFRPDRVTFIDRPGGGSTIATTVAMGPSGVELSSSPGRIDPNNAAFNASRKPLAGEFMFNGQKVFIIANHFKSKGGDQPLFGRFQPPVLASEVQRIAQAAIVNAFVQDIQALDPQAYVVVLGDLNDFQFSNPLITLTGNEMKALAYRLPVEERYSYVFDDNGQVLDHVVVSNNLYDTAIADFVHLNAEFPPATRASDHDPMAALLTIVEPPLIVWVDSVAIDGAVTGPVTPTYSFTGTVTPISATLPVTFTWTATEQTPVVDVVSGTQSVVNFTWVTTGTKTITVTASNGGTAVMDTHTIVLTATIPVEPDVPVTAVDLVGPVVGGINTSYNYLGTASPSDATLPITYTWTATDQTPVVQVVTDTSDSLSYTWATTGTKTITLTAENAAGSATTILDVVISAEPPADVPVTAVSLSGPVTGTITNTYAFTTTAWPMTATVPVTFVWEATGQTAVTDVSGDIQSNVSFTWVTTGTKVITVTATNVAGSATMTHTIVITDVPVVPPTMYYLYLPFAGRGTGNLPPTLVSPQAMILPHSKPVA